MPASENHFFCTECGTENPIIASFCINCGLDLRILKKYQRDEIHVLSEHLEPLGFKIQTQIADGSSGRNYLAENIKKGGKVVVKFYKEELSNDPLHRKFIINGAQVPEKINHINVHKSYSYGELNGRLYTISEFADNGPLNWTIDYYGSNGMPIPIALTYLIQILNGLEAIHRAGYIHRDLKVSNVYISKKGIPIISGFNFSGTKEEFLQNEEKHLYGTVAYMSPERCHLSNKLDHRTDIYSAGIILYQLLSGELPFQGDTPTIVYHHTNKPLPIVTYRLIARGLNTRSKKEEKLYLYANELQNIIEKACAKSRKNRYKTALEFSNVLKEFLEFTKTPLPDKKSKNEQWRVLKGYEADQSGGTGEDKLGITGAVESFARLVSSRSVEPPLSIGLFGNWGSGKSFFIGKLKEEISQITKEMETTIESGVPESELPFYSRIVQIEFNAWHFVDANLWPSLVHHIFSNLKMTGDSGTGITERRNYLIQKIESKKKGLSDLESQESEFLDKLKTLEKEIEVESENYTERIGKIFQKRINAELEQRWENSAFHKIAQKAGLDLSQEPDTGSKLVNIYKTAKSEESKTLWEKWKRKFKGYSIFVAFLCIAFAFLAILFGFIGILEKLGYWDKIISPIDNSIPFLGSLLSFLGTCLALFKTGIHFTKQYFSWAPKFWETAKEIFPDVESELNLAEQEREEKLQKLEEEKKQYLEEKEKVCAEIEKLESELEKTNAGDVLKNFIMSRIGSDDYSKHLGIQAKIRDDFEKLSQLITEYNQDVNSNTNLPKEQSEHLFNRIVLYIDDLDRCPPEKVVEVLQAVHLLLSFPAFIVIVAVDSRWVIQSLQYGYKELFGNEMEIDSDGDGIPDYFRATPHDYLEKIFQIPFWLYPMNSEGRRNLITKLMETSMIEKESEVNEGYEDEMYFPEDLDIEEEDSSENANENSKTHFKSQLAIEKSDQLVIQQSELDFSIIISPLLGQSPRALKRFANVYLLVKVELSDLQWEIYFEKIHPQTGRKEEPGVSRNFQAVMFLLAIITGLPATSKIFFKALRTRSVKSFPQLLESINVKRGENGWLIMGMATDEMSLLKRAVQSELHDLKNTSTEANKLAMQLEMQTFTKWLDANKDKKDWLTVDIEQLRYWDPIVSKYSFRVEPFEQD